MAKARGSGEGSVFQRKSEYTGMREAEILGLRWRDVDLDRGELTVRVTLQRVGGRLVLSEPKTKSSRRAVSLPSAVVCLLQQRRDSQRFQRKQAEAAGVWADPWGLVFTNEIGQPLNGWNLSRALGRVLASAELPRLRFHDLRHTAASLLLADGVDVVRVSAMLGHRNSAITHSIYAHALPKAKQEVADRMARLLAQSAAAD